MTKTTTQRVLAAITRRQAYPGTSIRVFANPWADGIARRLDLSPATVRRAVRRLVAQDKIVVRRWEGTINFLVLGE